MKHRRKINRKRRGFLQNQSLTNILIFINVIFFLAFIFFSAFFGLLAGDADAGGNAEQESLEGFVSFVALKPSLILQGYVWTFLTSMFMHANFTHLFVNMVSMFFIGNFLEKLIGRKRFLWFYLISGIIAGLFFVGFAYFGQLFQNGQAFFGGVDDLAVGASGALFGLGGLLAVLIPRLRVLVFFIIPMPMWLGMSVLMFGLWIFSAVGGLPIGNTAHFGGLAVGVVYGFYLRNKYPRKIRMLNRMFV